MAGNKENSARRRVLFIRTGPIGNTMAAVPALRALRKGWPDAHITAMVEKSGREVLQNCPYVDKFIIYEKRGGRKGLGGWLKTVIELRRGEFTHVILSKRFFRVSFMAYLTGAPVRVGFAGYGYKLTEAVRWLPGRHVIDTNLDLVRALGVEPAGRELEIWPSEGDKKAAVKFLKEAGLYGHEFIVAIHPGGVSQGGFGWPLKNYAELAEAMADKYAAAPLFVGGPPDRGVMDEIERLTGGKYSVSADLNLRGAAHLLAHARIFIGADSAPAHLAEAVGTPGIVYYGPKEDMEVNIRRWKPESDLWLAAAPTQAGEHLDVRNMLGHVGELLHRMSVKDVRNG